MKIKILLSLLCLPFFTSKPAWMTNLDDARQLAKTKHEHILLNFSGSDWCGPCIRMHKEIFENEIFLQYAEAHLILVNADFPRLKKNRLIPYQQKLNDALADRYNPKGSFPYTVLLDADGRVLKTWDGFFPSGVEAFTGQLRDIIKNKSE